jgi:tRNA (guanine-N7-)-methyltransferase
VSARSDCPAVEQRHELWTALFGRRAPVEIEIGCGDGAFLLAYAARHPERDFFGVERSPAKARRLHARLAHCGLTNVRTVRGDATCMVPTIVPRASVAIYHVYFPDPWPKRGHAFRRIFSAGFIAALAETLVEGGRVHVATDVADYSTRIRTGMIGDARFAEIAGDGTHPGLQTSFARKYRAAGRALYTATFRAVQPAAASKMRSM